MTESSTRIVPSINIFINICCGLQILKAIVYASLESRCVLLLYRHGCSWSQTIPPLYFSFFFFPFLVVFV